MLSMTHLLLLSVIIASFYLPAYAGETSPADYDYEGGEPSSPPGKLEKPTTAPLMPYFKEGQVVVYVNRSAERVKLDCPVQKYDGERHSFMWERNGQTVSNGNLSIIKDYTVDNQLALTIPVENATNYNYSCRIIWGPKVQNEVRRNITVQFQSNGAQSIRWPTTFGCLVLSVLALIHPVTNRF